MLSVLSLVKIVINFFDHITYRGITKYNLSITNKVHIIFSHIQEVIYKTGKGLGEGSEQSLEACHHKFDVIWQWYKVKDHQSPNHGEQLFKCVQHFNSFNI